jgi:hypothetical protein
MPPRKTATPEELDKRLDEQRRLQADIRRIIERAGGAFTATSSCNDFLFRGHAETAHEIKGPLDAADELVRQQQAQNPGPKPPHADRYQDWASRKAAGEHITDIIRAEFPGLDAEGIEKVRQSFKHYQRTQRGRRR